MVTALVGMSAAVAGTARGDDSESAVHTAIIDRVSDEEARVEPDDESPGSISCGRANRGALHDARELPRYGYGYEIPDPWWSREHRFGTDELVGLIERAAAAVAEHHPGAMLGVADLSKDGGGALRGHRSHQSGRDVDLIYYALDDAGEPFRPDEHMAYYGRAGRGSYARSPRFVRDITARYFDLARNWALVKALIGDSEVEVEHIFVSSRVRQWLLDYARRVGEPPELLDLAKRTLRRPRGADSHNDHMHIRVRCSAEDEALGRCRNPIAQRPRRGRRWHSRVTCPALPLVSMPTLRP